MTSTAPLMQVLLPALRSDIASLPLPCNRLQHAHAPPPTEQCRDSQPSSITRHHKGPGQPTASSTAPPAAASCSHLSGHGSSQESLAVSTSGRLDVEAAESTSASAAPAAPDDIPIQPLNKQTAIGTCVSPKVGRRTTPFSTSEPSHQSVPASRQDTAATPAAAQHDTPMHDATAVNRAIGNAQELSGDSQQHTAMQGASTADECQGSCWGSEEHPSGARSYLTCCVRLSVEKEPHR